MSERKKSTILMHDMSSKIMLSVCVYGIIPWELSSITSSSQSKTVYVVEAIINGTLRKHREIRKPRVAMSMMVVIKMRVLENGTLN